VELISAITSAAASGLMDVMGCTWTAWLNLSVCVAFAVLTLGFRPHATVPDRVIFCTVAATTAGCGIAVVASGYFARAQSAASMTLTANAVLSTVSGFYEIFKLLREQIRRRRQHRKGVRVSGSQAFRRILQREDNDNDAELAAVLIPTSTEHEGATDEGTHDDRDACLNEILQRHAPETEPEPERYRAHDNAESRRRRQEIELMLAACSSGATAPPVNVGAVSHVSLDVDKFLADLMDSDTDGLPVMPGDSDDRSVATQSILF
jgi:hypothetical protein